MHRNCHRCNSEMDYFMDQEDLIRFRDGTNLHLDGLSFWRCSYCQENFYGPDDTERYCKSIDRAKKKAGME